MNADTVFTCAYLLCVVSFVCAMLLYAALRKNSPDLAWHRHGKVNTSQFHQFDILGVLLFVLIYGAILVMAQAPPEIVSDGESPKEIKVTPMIMIAGMISQQVVFVLIVLALMMFRGTNFVELFGLNWKKKKYMVLIAPAGVILRESGLKGQVLVIVVLTLNLTRAGRVWKSRGSGTHHQNGQLL